MSIAPLGFSFLFIALVLTLSYTFYRAKCFSAETIRKFIHIGVSNWWFILIAAFDNIWMALLGPILFVIVNSLFVVTNLTLYFNISDKKRDLGLIYYPISLIILVFLSYSNIVSLYHCGIGWLALGYGDGLAAIIGKKYGKRKFGINKSALGSTVMFVTTLIAILGLSFGYKVVGLSSPFWYFKVLLLAFLATLIEAYTPFALDNLTVPLGVTLLSYLIMGG